MKTTTKIDLTTTNHREVTGGMNGYPVPVLGIAIFADSVEELKETGIILCLDKLNEFNGVEIHEFRWKSGWNNCTDSGEHFSPDEYAFLAKVDLANQDYPSEWDLESVTEISYTDDADHFRLGLFIDFSEGWRYVDDCKAVELIEATF